MQPFLGQLPGHVGNGGWCADGPCSQHEHNASELAGCGGAAGFEEGNSSDPLYSNNIHS